MHLPQIASLASRQSESTLLPYGFCSPTCPDCRTDVTLFNNATSCVPESAFLNDCSSCQKCIIDYQEEQGTAVQTDVFQLVLRQVLQLCSNATANGQVVALQSQAALLSAAEAQHTAEVLSNPTSATIMQTSTHASATAVFTPTPAVTSLGSSVERESSGGLAAHKAWIVGPIVGSLVMLITVLIAILLFRRRQKPKEAINTEPGAKRPEEGSESGESRGDTPRPFSDIMEPRELETREVYELPAAEPVGSELHTPRDGKMEEGNWPLPIAPLRAMFAQSVMRDEKLGSESTRHKTFYNP